MIKNGITYNKFYLNGVEYNKGFRNNVQIFGANTPSILDGAELYLPLDSPDSRVNTYNNPLFVSGKKGNALSFNGSNQYGTLNGYDINNSNISFGCWVKFNEPQPQYTGMFGKTVYGSSVGRWGIIIGENNKIAIIYQSTPSSTHIIEDTATITQYYGMWVNIVGVIDLSSSKINLYINGQLIGSDNTTPASNLVTNTLLFLGVYGDASGTTGMIFFKGLIDEAFFMRKALTSSQVLQLYNEYS